MSMLIVLVIVLVVKSFLSSCTLMYMFMLQVRPPARPKRHHLKSLRAGRLIHNREHIADRVYAAECQTEPKRRVEAPQLGCVFAIAIEERAWQRRHHAFGTPILRGGGSLLKPRHELRCEPALWRG